MFTRSSNENACDPTSSLAMINKGKKVSRWCLVQRLLYEHIHELRSREHALGSEVLLHFVQSFCTVFLPFLKRFPLFEKENDRLTFGAFRWNAACNSSAVRRGY